MTKTNENKPTHNQWFMPT